MDITLVNMPYAPVRIPSLALGILQAVLERDGFAVSSNYANIGFAKEIGVREYSQLWLLLRSDNAIAEWTFAHIAFPEKQSNEEEFIALLEERNSKFLDLSFPAERLRRAREVASKFIDHLTDSVLDACPRVVGCTSTFFQHVPSLALLRRIRERDPDVVSIMGGANCEASMGLTTHKLFPWVDYVVSGEAEGLISGLCRNILSKGRNVVQSDLPSGVFGPINRLVGYPKSSDSSGDGVPRAVIQCLDHQPVPNYDDYFKTLDETPTVKSVIKPGLLVEASRGCWWKQKGGCLFCGLNGSGKIYRPKPAFAVLNELKTLQDRYKVSRFEMVDNVLGLPFLKSLLPEITKLGAPYDLFFEIRASLKRSHIEDLRKAGVIWVQPGIESLHTQTLKLMNKGSECWQNIQILKWLAQFGIRCSWIMMYGFPGEEDIWYEEMASYLPWLTHLEAPRGMTRVRFVRFSSYHSHPEEYGITLTPAKPFSLTYPLEEHQLADLVYVFDEESQLRDMKAPILSQLLLRPGLSMVKRVQEEWVRAHAVEPTPSLVMKVNKDSLTIMDSRSIAKQPEILLHGMERDIYLECDEAPLVEELMDQFERQGYSRQQILETLKHLDEMRIMLHIDGRYVSLALRDPVTPKRPFEDFPGGYLVQGNSVSCASENTPQNS